MIFLCTNFSRFNSVGLGNNNHYTIALTLATLLVYDVTAHLALVQSLCFCAQTTRAVSRRWRAIALTTPHPECGTNKTVQARCWPWLSGQSHRNLLRYSLFARKRCWWWMWRAPRKRADAALLWGSQCGVWRGEDFCYVLFPRTNEGGGANQAHLEIVVEGIRPSEHGTYKTVKTRFWPWRSGKKLFR